MAYSYSVSGKIKICVNGQPGWHWSGTLLEIWKILKLISLSKSSSPITFFLPPLDYSIAIGLTLAQSLLNKISINGLLGLQLTLSATRNLNSLKTDFII